MLNFYKEQKKETEEKLKILYRQLSNAGIGTKGDYQNKIDSLEADLAMFTKKIEAAEEMQQSESTPPETRKEYYFNLIANGKLKKAIKEYGERNEDDKVDTVILLGQLNNLKRDKNRGILSSSDATLKENKIMNAFIGLID